MSPLKRRALGIALALTLLVAGFATMLPSAPRSETRHSVESVAPDGRRAAFALLDELGFAPRAWDERPGLLPRGRQVLWLPGVPIDPRERESADERGAAEGPDALDVAQADSLRSPLHYADFLERGGRIVAPLSPEMLDFLRDELELGELDGARAEELAPIPGPVRLASGEELELELESAWRLLDLDDHVQLRPLASSLDGEAVALEMPVGDGALVLLAGDGFLDNSALRQADNALFLVRLAEGLGAEDGVLFDEHALGLWSESSALALAFAPDLRLVSLHVLLVALLATWALAWAREFPRDPAPLAATAPIERARSISALALRAERPGVLARELVRGTLQRIALRLGVPLHEGESARRSLERLSGASSSARSAQDLERWDAELLRRAVRSRSDLAQLDDGLRALELELCGAPSPTFPRSVQRRPPGPAPAPLA
jgi:hypothetical protein